MILGLIGSGALCFLLVAPHGEGRNAHATVLEVYFADPFLAYVYVGSIPFFLGLHRGFRLLGDVREKGACTPATVEALRFIMRCAWALLGFVAGGLVLVVAFGEGEDRPPGIVMGLVLALMVGGVVLGTARLARRVRRAMGRPGDLAG